MVLLMLHSLQHHSKLKPAAMDLRYVSHAHYVSIIIIIMFLKGYACFLFLDPQDEVGPSISSSVVLCFFVILVYNVLPVLVVCVHPLYML